MKHRKLLSVLLALVMLVGLLPAAALAGYGMTWNDLADAMDIDEGQEVSIKLTNDLKAGEGAKALVVPKDVSVTLDLGSYTIDADAKFDAVITVEGTLTLMGGYYYDEDEDEFYYGSITGGNSAGIVVGNGGTLSMSGGCVEENDIGVYVADGGTFTMSGGEVDYNDVGVYVANGGRFTMSNGDGDIWQNDIGVYVADGGTFTMSGGMIDYNNYVGLVVADGTAEMSRGLVCGNDIGVLLACEKTAKKPNFTLSGGVIGPAYVEDDEDDEDVWAPNAVGVMVGLPVAIGPLVTVTDDAVSVNETALNKIKGLMAESSSDDDDSSPILRFLSSPEADAPGGLFVMEKKGEIRANDMAGVIVAGGYSEAEDGAVTYKARFDMQGGIITDLPDEDVIGEQSIPEALSYDLWDMGVALKIGVLVNNGDVTMANAAIAGAWTEDGGLVPVEEDDDDEYITVEVGVFMTNGSLNVGEGAEIVGHNIAGVIAGDVMDAFIQSMLEAEGLDPSAADYATKYKDSFQKTIDDSKYAFDRLGTAVTVDGGTIANNGVIGVVTYGEGETAADDVAFNTAFTMNDGAIEGGAGTTLPVLPIPIPLHAQVGLAAIGTEVAVKGGVIGQEKASPLFTEDMYVLLQLGVLGYDSRVTMSGGKVTGNNIGGILMGYLDDYLAIQKALDDGDKKEGTTSPGTSIDPGTGTSSLRRSIFKEGILGEKTGNIITLSGSASVENNGCFGIFTAGAHSVESPAVVTVAGGTVKDNFGVGIGGYASQITLNGGEISGGALGVLAAGFTTLDVNAGSTITDNTTGALAAGLATVNLNGGAIVDNIKAFTVDPADAPTGKDSLDTIMAWLGIGSLPAVGEILETSVPLVARYYLAGVNNETDDFKKQLEDAKTLVKAMLSSLEVDILDLDFTTDEENPDKYIEMVRQMLQDFQQVGVVLETATSKLNLKSGEISGNAHGILGLSVDAKLPTLGGIFFDGAAPSGNTTDDLSLLVLSERAVDENNVAKEEEHTLTYAPVVTVTDMGGTVVRAAERKLVARYSGPDITSVDDVKKQGADDADTPTESVATGVISIIGQVKGVDYEPVLNTAFTKGGDVNNFQSAMEGILVAEDSDGDGEVMFIEGVTELTLNEEGATLQLVEGGTFQLHATVKAPEGCSTAVVWTSSDETIATVSASGVVTGVKAGGPVTITAIADGGASETCQINVTPKAADTPIYSGSTSESVKTTVTVNGTDYEVKATVSDGVLTPNAEALADILKNLDKIESLEFDAGAEDAKSVEIPAAVAGTLAEKMTDESKGIALITADGALMLNAAAVRNLMSGASGNLVLNFAKIDEKDLNANQRKQLSGTELGALLRAGVSVGGKNAHELGVGGEAMMLTWMAQPQISGLALRGAYLDPNAAGIATTAVREAEFLADDRPIGNHKLTVNGMLVSGTCSEYALYFVEGSDADDVASCGRGDDCPLAAFTDVDPDAWYHDGIHYVLLKGFMQGLGDGIFDPGGTTTRAMAAQLLWNMEGKPAATAAIPFADVAADAWYASAVAWAAENGVVEGWTDAATGKQVFAPDEFVTREQFAAMLYRYAKLHGLGFTGLWSFRLEFPDAADVSDWALEAMSWMVMQGIINGIDGKLVPQGSSTRAQIATMVYRYDAIKAE